MDLVAGKELLGGIKHGVQGPRGNRKGDIVSKVLLQIHYRALKGKALYMWMVSLSAHLWV